MFDNLECICTCNLSQKLHIIIIVQVCLESQFFLAFFLISLRWLIEHAFQLDCFPFLSQLLYTIHVHVDSQLLLTYIAFTKQSNYYYCYYHAIQYSGVVIVAQYFNFDTPRTMCFFSQNIFKMYFCNFHKQEAEPLLMLFW